MPVQINEVIIRAVVDSRPNAASNSAVAAESREGTAETELAEKILEIINIKKER